MRPGRLVFLHGFTQTHHHWHDLALTLADRLGDAPALTFVDLPGHGLSAGDVSPIAGGAAAVADLAGAGTYVGYSMGGRFGLLAALTRPDLVERLVLVGATAGLADASDRAHRLGLDDERARRLERIGVDAFLAEWMSAPMFAGLPPDPEGLAHRRRNDVAGLAASLRTSGTGSQPSVWDRLHEIAVPTLVLAGEFDTKFVGIGRRLAAAIPAGRFAEVAAAGHAAHLEAPDATIDTIVRWLDDG